MTRWLPWVLAGGVALAIGGYFFFKKGGLAGISYDARTVVRLQPEVLMPQDRATSYAALAARSIP